MPSRLPNEPKSPTRDIIHAQRVEQAIRMRVAGYQWQDIADAYGVTGQRIGLYRSQRPTKSNTP